MKKIINFVVMAVMCLGLYSCVTPAQAQVETVYIDEEGNIDVQLVLTYGTPYYFEGTLLYYIYRGVYYYPRYFDGRIYGFYKHRTRPHFLPQYPARPRPHVTQPRHRVKAFGPDVIHNSRPQPNVRPGDNRNAYRKPNLGGFEHRNGNNSSMRPGNPTRPNNNGSRGHFGSKR